MWRRRWFCDDDLRGWKLLRDFAGPDERPHLDVDDWSWDLRSGDGLIDGDSELHGHRRLVVDEWRR